MMGLKAAIGTATSTVRQAAKQKRMEVESLHTGILKTWGKALFSRPGSFR